MKYFLLLILFSFSTFGFAQSTIDFEATSDTSNWVQFSNVTNDPANFIIAPNPAITPGLNETANAAKLNILAGADPWAGVYSKSITPFVITAANAHPTVMVYKSVISNFDFKLEGVGSNLNVDHNVPNTKINQWEMLSFDYTAAIGDTVKRITIIPDFPSTRTAGSVDYFDLVTFIQPVVPVELTSFTAVVLNNKVELRWNTETENNNSGFEIQRSKDNSSFAKIGFIPGHGTTTSTHEYSFIDANAIGHVYYRIKQLDLNGTFKYSKVVEAAVSKPVSFSLNQNYPNPFNPTTTISYSIPENSFVTIKLYDVLGNEVASLVKSQMEAGEHSINFNASNLSSGIYYYQLTAGKNISTKKLILMK